MEQDKPVSSADIKALTVVMVEIRDVLKNILTNINFHGKEVTTELKGINSSIFSKL